MLPPAACAALDDPELRGRGIHVYFMLLDELSAHHPIALKNAYIAHRVGVDKRRVRHLLNLLVNRGHLLRGPPTEDGLHTYQLSLAGQKAKS